MIANRSKTKLTVDEFLEEFTGVDDGNLYELQDGEVVATPPPGSEHGELHFVLGWLIGIYEEAHPGIRGFDASGIEFSDDTLRGPDVSIFKDSDTAIFKKSRVQGVPSVIVEIVSPGKPRLDLVRKRGLYTSVGVAEIWFLDPESAEALFLCKERSGKYVETRLTVGMFESKALKGMRIDIAALFALDKRRLRKALERKV